MRESQESRIGYAVWVGGMTLLSPLSVVGVCVSCILKRTVSTECVQIPCDVGWAVVWQDAMTGFIFLRGDPFYPSPSPVAICYEIEKRYVASVFKLAKCLNWMLTKWKLE